MNTEQIYAVIIIILVLLILNDTHNNVYEYFTSNFVVANFDKRPYKVVGGFSDKHVAANKLALLHDFIVKFLKFVKTKYNTDKSLDHSVVEFFKRVLTNYNLDNIFENEPLTGEETSFVTNKGQEFGVCLRKKGTNKDQMHEMNILKFVMLHELTHLGCVTYGHKDEFWTSFKMVLTLAVESGLYEPIDYKKTPINYCGLDVFDNPYCDGINKC